jgi:hypothetical protein
MTRPGSCYSVTLLAEFVDQQCGPVLERADCHQRIDLDSRNGQFGTDRHAFFAIAIDALDQRPTNPLHAEFIRHHVNIYSKATMFQRHDNLQTHNEI